MIGGAGIGAAGAAWAAGVSVSPPEAFGSGDWSVVGTLAGHTAAVTITNVPSGTEDIEYRVDGGSEVSFGSADPDTYDITGLPNWSEVDIEIRPIGAGGVEGEWSTAKPATPESPNLLTNPSFETDTTGWTLGSPTWSRETGPTRAKHTHNSTNSVHLIQNVSITGGRNYRLRGKLRERSGNGAGGSPALISGTNTFFDATPSTTADHDYDSTKTALGNAAQIRLPGTTALTYSWTDLILQDLDDI
jgi:hypothetical protein